MLFLSAAQSTLPIQEPSPAYGGAPSRRSTTSSNSSTSFKATASSPPPLPSHLPLHSLRQLARSKSIVGKNASTKPWRDDGYPAFCRFMASSNDFCVFRRFNTLNTRVLLSLQDDIVQFENELNTIDSMCANGPEETEHSDSLRLDRTTRRRAILGALQPMLKGYNEYLSSYSEVRKQSTAQDYQVDNIKAWFEEHPNAIYEDERKFIDQGNDLIPIVAQRKSWTRLGIERLPAKLLRFLFRAKSKPGRVEEELTVYASNKKMNATMTFLIVTLGLLLLLVPMWWLSFISEMNKQLGVITGFVIVFTVILSSATVEQPFEVLIGTAGYAAVLMVFVQQQIGSNNAYGLDQR